MPLNAKTKEVIAAVQDAWTSRQRRLNPSEYEQALEELSSFFDMEYEANQDEKKRNEKE
jgi:antitoxin component HigA of HigAB toxin-antitoxin module